MWIQIDFSLLAIEVLCCQALRMCRRDDTLNAYLSFCRDLEGDETDQPDQGNPYQDV